MGEAHSAGKKAMSINDEEDDNRPDRRRNIALLRQLRAGRITEAELRTRWRYYPPHSRSEHEQAITWAINEFLPFLEAGGDDIIQSAVEGALAEIGHRPFTEEEVADAAKDALGLSDEVEQSQ